MFIYSYFSISAILPKFLTMEFHFIYQTWCFPDLHLLSCILKMCFTLLKLKMYFKKSVNKIVYSLKSNVHTKLHILPFECPRHTTALYGFRVIRFNRPILVLSWDTIWPMEISSQLRYPSSFYQHNTTQLSLFGWSSTIWIYFCKIWMSYNLN
jgi:hypothetical protein